VNVLSAVKDAGFDGVITICTLSTVDECRRRFAAECEPLELPVTWGIKFPGSDITQKDVERWSSVRAFCKRNWMFDSEIVLDLENDIDDFVYRGKQLNETELRAAVGDFRDYPRRMILYPVGYRADRGAVRNRFLAELLVDCLPQAVLINGECHENDTSSNMGREMMLRFGSERQLPLFNVTASPNRRWYQHTTGAPLESMSRYVAIGGIGDSAIVYVSQYETLKALKEIAESKGLKR
jgi:hypothetical protein